MAQAFKVKGEVSIESGKAQTQLKVLKNNVDGLGKTMKDSARSTGLSLTKLGLYGAAAGAAVMAV